MSEKQKQDALKDNTLGLDNKKDTLTLDIKVVVPKPTSLSKRIRGKLVEVEVKNRGRRKKVLPEALLDDKDKNKVSTEKDGSTLSKPTETYVSKGSANVLTDEEKERRENILKNIQSSSNQEEKIVVASQMRIVSSERTDSIVEYQADKAQNQVNKVSQAVGDDAYNEKEDKLSEDIIQSTDIDPLSTESAHAIDNNTDIDHFQSTSSPKEPDSNLKIDDSFYEDKEVSIKHKKKPSVLETKRQPKTAWKSVYIEGSEEEDLESDLEDVVPLYEEETLKEVLDHVELPYSKTQKRKGKAKHKGKSQKIVKTIKLSDPISVSDLALQVAEKSKVLLNALRSLGVSATNTTVLDIDTIELLLAELGHNFVRLDKKYIEDEYTKLNLDKYKLVQRSPVVTIMGHVDHGKTTLLDTIRKSSIVDKESGGITQHIGAYQVALPNNKMITFLDTPGHEAFTEIRSRGSSVTDIVILVVASDDSVKPQTVEAIQHAQQAEVPIIVAINKMDKPEANPVKVKTELLKYNVIVEEMGGDVLCVEISAKNNQGIDNLLENVLLQAELMDLKSPLDAPAIASIVEVKQEKGLGVLATVLVQRGALKIGDVFVCNTQVGRIKAMIDDKKNRVSKASISVPVEISGFTGIVEAGHTLLIVPSEKIANEIVSQRLIKQREESKEKKFDLSALLAKSSGDVKTLAVVVKADTQGVLEAIVSSLGKIKHPEVQLKIILKGVGEITETDISLSKTSGAIVVGFNVRANTKALDIAKQTGIEVRYHSIIYNLIDDVKLILSGMLDPDIVENILGYAEVRRVFNITKFGNVAGCYVTEGYLKRNSYVRLLRNNVVIHNGVLSTLKREKDDVKEVKSNMECGASFEHYNDIQVNDRIECYDKVEVRNSIK